MSCVRETQPGTGQARVVGSGAGTESKKTWAVDGKVSHMGRTPHWAQNVCASLASGEQRHCDGVWL